MVESHYIKKGLYFFILGILILPYIQKRENMFEMEELKGHFEKKEIIVPPLQIKTYKTGEFQENYKAKYKEEFGFKNLLIRIHNQLNYSLFNVANSRGVIVSENNVMMPDSYIRSYLGVDRVENERMEELCRKAKLVQDSLIEKGKAFFFLIAPGKVALYPEYIPEYYYKDYSPKTSNYEVFTKYLSEYGVNYVDYRRYLIENKEQFKYPIFPAMGIHWSGNTVAHVLDSLLSYINNEHGIPVQQIELSKGLETIEDYRYTDYDIGESMNLLWFASEEILHYPIIDYQKFDKKQPTFLGVGDSFIESFMGFYDILDKCFSENSRVWFYNRIIDLPKELHGIEVTKLSLEKELENKDIIFVETSDENIRMLGFNFIEDLYDHFTGQDTIPLHLQSKYEELIKDPSLVAEAEQLSKKIGYSVEESIQALVRNRIKMQPLADFDFEKEVKEYIRQIKHNKKWLELVKKQAIEQNIPLEENIRANAVWMVNEKLGRN